MEEQQLKQVEAYFKRKMTFEENEKFEEDIRKNSELKRIVDEYQLTMDVIDQQEEIILKEKFIQWKKAEKKTITPRLVFYSSIAATIAVLFGIFAIKSLSGPNTYKELAYTSYQLPDSPSASMGDSQIHRNAGIMAFKTNSFQEAVEEWSQMEVTDSEIDYYLAHSYFNLELFSKASVLFNEIAKGTSTFNYPSDWYLLLCYLSEGNMVEFNQQMEKIITDKQHPYYDDAVSLKEKLKKIKR
jgi:hypothetical protein